MGKSDLREEVECEGGEVPDGDGDSSGEEARIEVGDGGASRMSIRRSTLATGRSPSIGNTRQDLQLPRRRKISWKSF